jgi:hypothetical protein
MAGGQCGLAGTIGSAVVKSGSPISRWITSWPACSSACARASRDITWNGAISWLRRL